MTIDVDNPGGMGNRIDSQTEGASRIRILVVDDHALFAETLSATLALDARLEIIGHARDGAQAIGLFGALRPDVVLMDLHMPVVDGIAATEWITRIVPEARVVIVTASSAPDDARRARAAGAVDYLTKDSRASELVRAVLRAAAQAVSGGGTERHTVACAAG